MRMEKGDEFARSFSPFSSFFPLKDFVLLLLFFRFPEQLNSPGNSRKKKRKKKDEKSLAAVWCTVKQRNR